MIEFRDAIAAACLATYCECPNDGSTDPESRAEADAVLALPEMQALRVLAGRLVTLADEFPDEQAWDEGTWDALLGLPSSVREWLVTP